MSEDNVFDMGGEGQQEDGDDNVFDMGGGEENDGAIISRMVDEMKKHRDAYVAAASEKTNELGAFWLRKTRKPVLAVLCVRKKGGEELEQRSRQATIDLPQRLLARKVDVEKRSMPQKARR